MKFVEYSKTLNIDKVFSQQKPFLLRKSLRFSQRISLHVKNNAMPWRFSGTTRLSQRCIQWIVETKEQISSGRFFAISHTKYINNDIPCHMTSTIIVQVQLHDILHNKSVSGYKILKKVWKGIVNIIILRRYICMYAITIKCRIYDAIVRAYSLNSYRKLTLTNK